MSAANALDRWLDDVADGIEASPRQRGCLETLVVGTVGVVSFTAAFVVARRVLR